MNTLYQVLSACFAVIVVISNIISVKLVKLPFFSDFSIPVGLITYPLTFLVADLVTEFYGAKKAKLMVYIALGMNLLSFGIIELALMIPAHSAEEQRAFQAIMGLSGLRIFASLAAYLAAQVVDIQLYAWIKRLTGSRFLWLRNNGSTFASQIVDTVIVDVIFLWWGLSMPMAEVVPIMIFAWGYKAFFSLAGTPLFYFCVHMIRKKQVIYGKV